jgi:hypothetical protein
MIISPLTSSYGTALSHTLSNDRIVTPVTAYQTSSARSYDELLGSVVKR